MQRLESLLMINAVNVTFFEKVLKAAITFLYLLLALILSYYDISDRNIARL